MRARTPVPSPRPRSRSRLFRIASIASFLTVAALLPSPGLAAKGDCGLPVNSAAPPKTSDCLFILRTAVQLQTCLLCTCDVNDSGGITASDALLCLRAAVGQNVLLTCPPCAAVCLPGSVEITTHAGYGDACSSNGDCEIGVCDPGTARCHTASELDLGWTGKAHNIDLDQGAVLRLDIACNDGGRAGCGVCSIEGVDASLGNCRCANNLRTVCDTPLQPDPECPACAGGAFAGSVCSQDSQCVGGSCAAHCAFDPELVCATNADCPTGRKRCDSTPRCGNGGGRTCASNGDCIGSCTASATCECYDSPPIPVASVEFPFCILPKLATDVTGTINVDTGESSIVKDLKLVTYSGLTLLSPCPVCGGTCNANHQTKCSSDDDCAPGDTCELDVVANDGVRDGVCIGGRDDGQPCDVGATNTSFPARLDDPGGGGYSLDCRPQASALFSGDGLRVQDVETTGVTTLTATVNCGENFPSAAQCPCLMCSGNSNVLCNEDEDCASIRICSGDQNLSCTTNTDCLDVDVGTCTTFSDTRCSGSFATVCTTNADCATADFGTCGPAECSSRGIGIFPRPNSCKDEICTDVGGGEGQCATGPDDRFCDGVVKADGGGIRNCINNADCSVAVTGFDAGACTLVERRSCFVDPIVGDGAADPTHPVATATFCVPPTPGVGKNTSIGLPGPARIYRQTTLRSLCADDPQAEYAPGSGSCPE